MTSSVPLTPSRPALHRNLILLAVGSTMFVGTVGALRQRSSNRVRIQEGVEFEVEAG